MQSAFGTVVMVVCAVGVAGALAALVLGRRTWDDYARDHLLMERQPGRPASGAVAAEPADAERDEEIRQMLETRRNHRRARQGKPPLDVESEVERQIALLNSR